MQKAHIVMMKPSYAILTSLAALFVCASASAQSVTAPAVGGIFKTIEGVVTVHSETQKRTPQVGQLISESDRIETGEKSGAALTMADGTVVSIGPNSSVTLASMRYEPVTQTGNLAVHLLQGAMRMITGNLSKTNPDSIQVTTPTAVIGVRGTDFIVEVKS